MPRLIGALPRFLSYPHKIKDGHLIPQHRLLTKKEWAWIKTPHRYSYWTTTGPITKGDFIYTHHKEIFFIDPLSDRAIKHQEPKP